MNNELSAVGYELEKHPWLNRRQARKIVWENLEDDPNFYDFLEEEDTSDEEETAMETTREEVEEEVEECHKEKGPKGPSLTVVIGG